MTLLLGICVIGLLSACKKPGAGGGDSDTRGGVSIEFWHYLGGPQGKAVDDLLRKFEAANPGIKVRGVFQGNPGALKQKLDGSFASGTKNNPTVSLLYENWTDDFLSHGYMDPVEDYFAGEGGLSDADKKDFVQAFIEGNTWDGKLVTLPFNKSIYLLHMNMDMMKAAGYTTAPKTQTELADAIRKTTVKTNGRTSTYGMGLIPKGEAMTTLMLAAGGKFLDENGRPTLNSPQALQALNFLKSLQYPEKNLYVNSDYMSVPFASKLIASFIYSSASLPYNQKGAEGKFQYVAAPVPGVDGATPRYLLQGTNIGMFANKSVKEREAGWKLIRFLTTAESATYFCTRSGYMPYRYSMLEQPDMKEYLAANPAYATGARLIMSDQGLQEPKSRAWEGIRAEMDKVVDKTLARPDSDPKALLDALQAQAAEKLK
jgi:multiple sugar transport system substrate-binding protein